MRKRTEFVLWWLSLDDLDRASVICAVIVIGFALFILAFLFEIV